MPSSFVHAAFAFLLAVGLLGRFYDRRALAVVLAVVLLPEADTLLGYAMDGAHRTVLHNATLVALAAGVLLWDTTRRDSWLRGRYGAAGVRVAWVALFVHAFAHLAMDWAHLSGINVLWPLHDRFFELGGEMYLSTGEGFVQTFVEVATDPETGGQRLDVGQGGTSGDTHVSSPAQPNRNPDPESVDRRFPIAVRGWQLYLVLTGAFALVAKHFQTSRNPADRAGDARGGGPTVTDASIRAYDPTVDADRRALWSLKADFEAALGSGTGDDAKAARYGSKLTAEYRERWLAWVDRCVADEARCVTVAERGDDLVGYVFVLPERLAFVWDAAVVNELYVAPPRRGTGVADDLLDAAVSLARDQTLPLDRLLLDVDPENDRARAFYARHGFEPWGEIVAREL